MNKFATRVMAFALCATAISAAAAFAANPVRISQVYGGGGGSTGTYLYDYVELFNNSGSSVNIGGWVLEYGSATGNWASSTSNAFTFPAGTTIGPCKYILVQLGPAGTVGAALPVTPDYTTANISASATNGKVGLFNALNSNLACGSELAGTLVDKVAYGTANCAEGTATAALTSTTTDVRNGAGTVDTDNNSADFAQVASGSVTLHNSSSPANIGCLATPTNAQTWGSIKTIYR